MIKGGITEVHSVIPPFLEVNCLSCSYVIYIRVKAPVGSSKSALAILFFSQK